MISVRVKHNWEIFEDEMLSKTLPTILTQIFYKNVFNFEVIVKNIIDPDDNFMSNYFALIG